MLCNLHTTADVSPFLTAYARTAFGTRCLCRRNYNGSLRSAVYCLGHQTKTSRRAGIRISSVSSLANLRSVTLLRTPIATFINSFQTCFW